MGAVNTTYTFLATDTITSTKMNNIIDETVITADAISGTTLEVTGTGKLKIRAQGVGSNELATDAVTTTSIASSSGASNGVTYAKIQHVANMKVIGNVTGSLAAPSEVSILDEDNMVSDSATAIPTQQSVKAYTDTKVAAVAITRGTAVATTSGTSVDFTSIPSTVKRITVMFDAVSNSGGDEYIIQIGDAGGIETTGYVSQSSDRGADQTATNGFVISRGNSSSSINYGTIIINNLSGNIWSSFGNFSRGSTVASSTGSKTLSATLDRIRITTISGVNTFDAGSVNIMYE
jgi:hypothetical protein